MRAPLTEAAFDMVTAGWLILGLVLLVAGAEALVRGAATMARRLGISSLIVGLTVVALGTSSAEIAVSVKAALTGSSDIVVGNVVGSNIANVLLILGVSALIVPLTVSAQLIRWDVPVMLVAGAGFWLFARDGLLAAWEAAILLAAFLGYSGALVAISLRGREPAPPTAPESSISEDEPPPLNGAGIARDLAWVAVGLVGLVLGADRLVAAASSIAAGFGISELVVSLTVVAVGTSLPELATSILAALRGERDLAVGNVVGSNIANVLCVLGVGGLLAPEGIAVGEAALQVDIPFMMAVLAACLPIFVSGLRIDRWEGALFLVYYVAYTAYLILKAGERTEAEAVRWAVGAFIGPLTLVTLAVLAWSKRQPGAAPPAPSPEEEP